MVVVETDRVEDVVRVATKKASITMKIEVMEGVSSADLVAKGVPKVAEVHRVKAAKLPPNKKSKKQIAFMDQKLMTGSRSRLEANMPNSILSFQKKVNC